MGVLRVLKRGRLSLQRTLKKVNCGRKGVLSLNHPKKGSFAGTPPPRYMPKKWVIYLFALCSWILEKGSASFIFYVL